MGRRRSERARNSDADASAATPSTSSGDPRARRTRERLHAALLALLREQPFESITVRDLSARADVNRATFYLHYRDKEDLVTRVFHDALDALARQAPTEPMSRENAEQALVGWFEHAAAYPDLYHLAIGRNDSANFLTQVRAHVERIIVRDAGAADAAPDQVPALMFGRYLASACLGVLGWWLEERMPYPPAQMGPWLLTLLERSHGGDAFGAPARSTSRR
ncbi:TetR/AcrR family transcriptional regulator [Haliangium ochraceum]|uniref:TetR/AcrR family transcriptional regulator n=1 Tax=Haliangium ochraceum TaxID=80816 RepID=UPI00030672B7|nr:TetR/AcrR family transcriptional regulator [Haliangium ochraceum]